MADAIRLSSAAEHTEHPPLPHQLAAWNWLQEQTSDHIAQFAEMYRAGPPKPPAPAVSNPLSGFPYFSQISADGSDGSNGWRQCQTSSLAMCLAYMKVAGINDDTDYLRIVNKYGDTTNQATHQAALKSLGINARFVTNCSADELKSELRAGRPAAIGVLHHGTPSHPTGGGHYIAVKGFTDKAWIVNDPYGELDLVTGTWARTGGGSGESLRYSLANLNPRWTVEGGASGWAWLFS
jgi:hypothetical protein